MSWALQFDGVNDYSSLNTDVMLHTDSALNSYRYEIFFSYTSPLAVIIGNSASFGGYLAVEPTRIRIRYGETSNTIEYINVDAFPNDGVYRKLTIKKLIDGTHNVYADDVLVATKAGTKNPSNSLQNVICRSAGNVYQCNIGYLYFYIDSAGSIPRLKLDATASDHSAGVQPVLLDTVGGNNATGVNFPTDGSAWVNLGGSSFNPAWAKNSNQIIGF